MINYCFNFSTFHMAVFQERVGLELGWRGMWDQEAVELDLRVGKWQVEMMDWRQSHEADQWKAFEVRSWTLNLWAMGASGLLGFCIYDNCLDEASGGRKGNELMVKIVPNKGTRQKQIGWYIKSPWESLNHRTLMLRGQWAQENIPETGKSKYWGL